jgi:hypothetical protein
VVARDPMHYHVIVVDGRIDIAMVVETFADWGEAEDRAFALSSAAEDWVATRYPGRSSRPGELCAYLDRRVMGRDAIRREISVSRCEGGEDCPSRSW